MTNHPVFENFKAVPSVGTGNHIFDFLGVATNVSYKKGWEKYAIRESATYTAKYPVVNEHYFDWIALLQCVQAASGTFRMAELGAGWAPWLVRGAFASRQNDAIKNVELLAVEADLTHYSWVKEHFADNDLEPSAHHLLHGAVAPVATTLKFPRLDNPEEDYGASLQAASSQNIDYVEVQGYPMSDILGHFSGPIDFIHIDIQGAEYDVIPSSMKILNGKVKAAMIGTHISSEKHLELKHLFHENGWKAEMIYPRNEAVETEFGQVTFGDGFQFWRNPNL